MLKYRLNVKHSALYIIKDCTTINVKQSEMNKNKLCGKNALHLTLEFHWFLFQHKINKQRIILYRRLK